jgi:metal-responsive CopG/Arc/MetJ family transcriptional regulator
MKITVSIPDRIFRAAERAARRMKVSRSELYAKALANFLEAREERAITEALNRVYPREESTLDPALRRMQTKSLEREEW